MIVLKSNPGGYYSAHGDLIFVVDEPTKAHDPDTYVDYKYIADIYVGGVLQVRLKRVPQPDSKFGVFNIGDIVRNYLLTTFNPLPTELQAQELGTTEFFIDVQVKFGEEYNGTLYTNILVDSTRKYYNHYNGRMVGARTILPNYLDKVASFRPFSVDVDLQDKFTLVPYFPTSTDPITITITKYGPLSPGALSNIEWGYFPTDPYIGIDSETFQFNSDYSAGLNNYALNFSSAGTGMYLAVKEPNTEPVKNAWQNTTYNYGMMPDSVFRAPIVIGAYRYYVSRIPVVLDSTNYAIQFGNGLPNSTPSGTSSNIDFTITPSAAFNMQIINLAPQLINNISPGFIDGSVDYYLVQIGDTSIYKFDIECSGKYETIRLHFLNKLGGFETKDFNKVSRKNIAITKSGYGVLPYKIGSDGSVNYYNNNGVYNDIAPVYFSQYTEQMVVNTDFISDDEYEWLVDLMASPLVYFEQSGYFIPCDITERSFEIRKEVNDRLTNITATVQFGDKFNAQQR